MERHEPVYRLAVIMLRHDVVDGVAEHPKARRAGTVEEASDVGQAILEEL